MGAKGSKTKLNSKDIKMFKSKTGKINDFYILKSKREIWKIIYC